MSEEVSPVANHSGSATISYNSHLSQRSVTWTAGGECGGHGSRSERTVAVPWSLKLGKLACPVLAFTLRARPHAGNFVHVTD